MVNLDDASTYRELDKLGMLDKVHEFPGECQRAWEKVQGFAVPKGYSKINKVVILGMGGSAIGADVVRRLALLEAKVPVWVQRDYDLPLIVDEKTLVIGSSYSGNTEETLSAFKQSLKTGAKKLVITTGGELKRIAEAEGIPVFIIDYKAPPRAAFAHSFVPLVGIFQKIGLLSDKTADLEEALQVMNKLAKELAETSPSPANPAKRLAAKLYGRIAVVYGAGVLSEVAQRWKGQMNENGKSLAFYEVLPELNHNAVVGYEFPVEAKKSVIALLLRCNLLHPRTLIRYEATSKLLEKAGISYEFVEAEGRTALAQMMSLILLGDYVSFYLAMLNRIDPTPVPSIDFLKGYLAKSPA